MAVQRRLPLGGAALLAIGVVIGFLLGGIGPRRELAARDEAVARLERALEEAEQGGWRAPVPGLDRILRGAESDRVAVREDGPRARERAPISTPREHDGHETETAQVALDGGVAPLGVGRRWAERSSDERLEGFRRAVTVQRVRRVQTRAALAQQANLNDEELAEVDSALARMNDELAGYGEEVLLLALGEEPPAARDLLGITHDVTGILHRAQLRLEEIVGPERAATVDASALEIWNHVDLARLEPPQP